MEKTDQNSYQEIIEDSEISTQNTDDNNEPKKKKYHSSALYAASMWHSAVKHVKSPNSGHTHLPAQM